VRLAEDDRARGPQQRDDVSIDRARRNVRARRAAGPGRKAGDVDHVLDRDRNAVKRTAQPAGLSLPPQGLRLRERALRIEQAPAAHILSTASMRRRADSSKPTGSIRRSAMARRSLDRAWIRNETAC
jgi:hypothetical protein